MKDFALRNEWRSCVPVPVLESRPDFLEIYWKAWQLAHDHIWDVPGMPQTPYMDEAFCDTDIWIWDSCFMSLFCKYSQGRFPGIETLDNFYKVLYEGGQLPTIITRNAPEWTGEVIGQPARIRVHLLDNPPLFAWAEYCNALMNGDVVYLRKRLLEKQSLQRHFEFLENLKEPYYDDRFRAPTWWRRHELGVFWEGGCSGMDNTPRGRIGTTTSVERPRNPDMLWVDAIAQQGLSALSIARMAELIGADELAREWRGKHQEIKELVNRYYWDEQEGFYFDISASTHQFIRVMTPASFWPVLAEMATLEQVERMCEKLLDASKLGGDVPCLSLSRDDGDFHRNGHYWRGGLWMPTAYMILKGIEKYGKYDLARTLSERIISHMYRTYKEFTPHTIWECYSPSENKPAMTCSVPEELCRKDFCGWSAVAPISLLIENVIGIHEVDAFAHRISWALPHEVKGKIGICGLVFGDTTTSLICDGGSCHVETNMPYTLSINGKDYSISQGKQVISLSA